MEDELAEANKTSEDLRQKYEGELDEHQHTVASPFSEIKKECKHWLKMSEFKTD